MILTTLMMLMGGFWISLASIASSLATYCSIAELAKRLAEFQLTDTVQAIRFSTFRSAEDSGFVLWMCLHVSNGRLLSLTYCVRHFRHDFVNGGVSGMLDPRGVILDDSNIRSAVVFTLTSSWECSASVYLFTYMRPAHETTTATQVFVNTCLRRVSEVGLPDTISNRELVRGTAQWIIDRLVKKGKWQLIGHMIWKNGNSVADYTMHLFS